MDDRRAPQPDFHLLMVAHANAMQDPFFTVPRRRVLEETPICQSCALCCRVTGLRTVSPFDVARLGAFLGLTAAEVRRRYVRSDVPSLHSPCSFLRRTEEGYTCGVHPARPELCRDFDRCGVLQGDEVPEGLTPKLRAELAEVADRLVLVPLPGDALSGDEDER